jgi:hypothetical protein
MLVFCTFTNKEEVKSLMASGVIEDTDAVIAPKIFRDGVGGIISCSDLISAATNMYNQIEVNKEYKAEQLNERCMEDYHLGLSLIKSAHPSVVLLRFYLNTKMGTVGRTYLPLLSVEIGKVKRTAANRWKVISKVPSLSNVLSHYMSPNVQTLHKKFLV